MTSADKKRFYHYLADYFTEELERDMVLDANTVQNAVDAFEAGAYKGVNFNVSVRRWK